MIGENLVVVAFVAQVKVTTIGRPLIGIAPNIDAFAIAGRDHAGFANRTILEDIACTTGAKMHRLLAGLLNQ